MSEWKTYKLSDLVTFQRGHDLTKIENVAGIYPVAGSNGIIGYHNNFTTKAPGITIGRSGNIGNPYYYDKDFWAHNTTLYVKEFKNCNPKFFYYLLKTINFAGHNSGSAVPSLNRNYIHPIEVTIPSSIEEQTQIAKILSSLDDKIELNLQMNQTLEAMAQAIFKEWFVDFRFPLSEPLIIDDLLDEPDFKKGRNQENHNNQKNHSSDNLPKGWRMGKLASVCEVKYGKDHKHLGEGYIPVYGSGGIMRFADKALYERESILIPRKGTLTNLFYVSKPFWSVDTMFYTIIKDDAIRKYLFYLLKTLNLASMNVGSAVPSLTTEVLNKIDILIPENSTLVEFEKITSTLYFKMEENKIQIKSLTQTRDTLLPKLMSGKISLNL